MGPKAKDVPKETQRIIVAGRPDHDRCDNMISTSKYNLFTFLPIVRTFSTMLCTRVFFRHSCGPS